MYFYIKENWVPMLISRKNNGKIYKSETSTAKSSIKFVIHQNEMNLKEEKLFEDGLGQREIAEYYKCF